MKRGGDGWRVTEDILRERERERERERSIYIYRERERYARKDTEERDRGTEERRMGRRREEGRKREVLVDGGERQRRAG